MGVWIVALVVLVALMALVAITVLMPLSEGFDMHEVPETKELAVVASYPHDPTLFTQGLVWSSDGRTLFESSGLYGRSFLQASVLERGHFRKEAVLPIESQFFAEDIALDSKTNTLLQLTWREGKILVWSAENPRNVLETRSLPPTFTGEGWGITRDSVGTTYISDGSAYITVVDPMNGKITRTHVVDSRGTPVSNLNALAFDERSGRLYANVWKTTTIVVIHPKTGFIERTLSVENLVPPSTRLNGEAVANGLAFHPTTGHVWLTGKYWDRIFECRI